MKLYKCRVRLHGKVTNEVRKEEVSAAEIALLKHIHGADAVLDIEEHTEVERTDAQERDRLAMIYGQTRGGSLSDARIDLVSRKFGPEMMPLPAVVEGVEGVPAVEPERKKAERPAKALLNKDEKMFA